MKKVVSLLLVVIMVASIFVGCSKTKVKNEDIAKTAAEAMQKLDSVEAEIKFNTTIDVEANGAQASVPVSLSGVLDSLKKDKAVYMKLDLEVMGQKQNMELYTFADDEKYTTYTKNSDSTKFVREIKDVGDSESNIGKLTEKLHELIEKWKWEVKEEKEFYTLSHTLSNEEIKELADTLNSMSDDSEDDLISDIAPSGSSFDIKDLKDIKVELEIAKETYYINKVTIDLTDAIKGAMNSIAEAMLAEGGKVSVKDLIVEVVFSKFNSVNPIKAPTDYIEGVNEPEESNVPEESNDPVVPSTNDDYQAKLNTFVTASQESLEASANEGEYYKMWADGKDVVLDVSREGLHEKLQEGVDSETWEELKKQILTGTVWYSLDNAIQSLGLTDSNLRIRIVDDVNLSYVWAESYKGVVIADNYTPNGGSAVSTDPVIPTEPAVSEGNLNINEAPLGKVDVAFKFNGKEYNFNSITPAHLLADGFNDVTLDDYRGNTMDAWGSKTLTYCNGDEYKSSTVELRYENNTKAQCEFKDCKFYSVMVTTADVFDNISFGDTFEVCGIKSGMTYDEIKAVLGEPDYNYESEVLDYKSYSWALTDELELSVDVSDDLGAYAFDISYFGN